MVVMGGQVVVDQEPMVVTGWVVDGKWRVVVVVVVANTAATARLPIDTGWSVVMVVLVVKMVR